MQNLKRKITFGQRFDALTSGKVTLHTRDGYSHYRAKNFRQRIGAGITGRIKTPPARRYFFDGAKQGLISGWFTGDISADSAIEPAMTTIRSRARDLYRNNDYVKKFVNMAIQNVIGHQGILLQSRARLFNGKPDTTFNRKIEQAWKDAGKKKNFPTLCGKMSRLDAAKLAVRTLIVDGEFIIHKQRRLDRNDSNFSFAFVDVDRLDHLKNEDLGNGRYIRMGVEVDEFHKPIAYHILDQHPGETYQFGGGRIRRHRRVPAEEIEHVYLMERPGQTRGISWLSAPMERMKMLDGFEQAVVVGARVAASKMGFLMPNEENGFIGEGVDPDGFTIMNADPGTWEELPKGMEVKTFDPNYPPANFEEFMKTILRGIASGLNVSYFNLANDLEGVNYSSARIGLLEERDTWKTLQTFMVEHFYEPIFSDWWEQAIVLSRIIDVAPSKLRSEPEVYWQPRGWQWVDPQKEVRANLEAIEGKIKTRTKVISEQGEDIEEVFETLAQEAELGNTYNIDLSTEKPAQEPNQQELANANEDDDEED